MCKSLRAINMFLFYRYQYWLLIVNKYTVIITPADIVQMQTLLGVTLTIACFNCYERISSYAKDLSVYAESSSQCYSAVFGPIDLYLNVCISVFTSKW